MNLAAPAWIGRVSRIFSDGIDHFFSSRWWWVIARARAERGLAKALERYGENSLVTRSAAQQCLRMDFALRYWRAAPGAVMQVVKVAENAGVPLVDLRIAVLNRELTEVRGLVLVRRQTFDRILSTIATTTVAMQWTLLMTLAVLANGALPKKTLVILAITATHTILYRAWSLYLGRPLDAIARSGERLRAVCQQAGQGRVHELRERTG